MTLTELGKTIANLGAPLLGGLVGGAPGAAVGQLITDAFGGDINDPAGLMMRINANTEAAQKLQAIESDHKFELQKLALVQETQNIELSNKNTADARDQNVKNHTIYPQLVSTIIVIGFFGCIYWVAAYKQDASDHDVLYMLLGVIGSSFGAVVNYWLGSSSDKSFSLKK